MLMLCSLAASTLSSRGPQAAQQKPSEKSPETAADKAQAKAPPKLSAQIDLLETRVRFEANGDSHKEIHALVKINDELGARQFSRLNFSYNLAFQSVEIPYARITHANGGTSDVLPSAISDNPDPTVVNFPAYQDVRVKSIRILGLAPDDALEYRVVTTTTHHPLSPDFWFDHTFDRSGVVSRETLELDLPASRLIDSEYPEKLPTPHINPHTAASSIRTTSEGKSARTIYLWDRKSFASNDASPQQADSEESDVSLSSFSEWMPLAIRLGERLDFSGSTLKGMGTYEDKYVSPTTQAVTTQISSKALQLTEGLEGGRAKLAALYDFVAQKIRTVDLPLGATGFVARSATDVLASGYATQEDKFVLFAALASAVKLSAVATLTGDCDENAPPRPTPFRHLLISAYDGKTEHWIDPSLEVAPFGVVPANSGTCAFTLERGIYALSSSGHEWQKLEPAAPFAAKQRVSIDAKLATDGTLSARAKYLMRGGNELLLRVAFHQSPREKWDDVAQLLALSDGFRGKVTKATASDPYETRSPFGVEYEIEQPKFADWSKKSLRIPALLPLLGLPDPPGKSAPGAAASPIELGTPLDVQVSMTLHLPEGTGAEVPAGTSVERDFATYSSQYSVNGTTLTASRHINFILKEISADRAAEYNAFLHAVQNDESQVFTLQRADTAPATAPKP